MKTIFIFIILLLSFYSLAAQNDSLLVQWAEFIEEDASLEETILQLLENPVSINQAGKSEFTNIPFLSNAQIDSILSLREELGTFKSIRQLRPVLGAELYGIVRPFLTSKTRKHKRGFIKQKNYYPQDFNKSAHAFNGGLWYNKTQLFLSLTTNIQVGFITHKDVGEQNFMDYYSGYFSYTKENWKLLLGQFNFRFGHGLVYANPFSTQKSAMVLNPLHSTQIAARPSLSSSENSGYFGTYILLENLLGFQLHGFYSQHILDGRLDDSNKIITGIDYDGYHRTEKESETKDRLTEQIFSLAIARSLGKYFNTSLLYSICKFTPGIKFNTSVVSENEKRRQYYKFSGKALQQFSAAYDFEYGRLLASGEIAASSKGGPGFSQKILVCEENIQFGISYWRIARDFQSPHGAVFNDSNPFPQAQEGLYGALKYQLNENITISTFRFITKDLWRSYFYELPQNKAEWFSELQIKIPERQFIFRIRQKLINGAAEDGQTTQDDKQTFYRFNYSWKPDKQLKLQSRIEHTHFHRLAETGTYVFQDIQYNFNPLIAVSTRLTYFQTNSFTSALYEYERDLPGSFANYVLYGRGFKWYLLLSSEPFSGFKFWLKFRFQKQYKDELSNASFNRDIRLQCNWYF